MIRRAPPRGAAQAGGKTTSTMRSVVIRNRAQSGVCTRCRLKRHHLAEAIRLDVSRTCRSSRTKRESRPSFRANCGPVAEVRPEQGRIGCIPPVWDIVLFDPDRTVCGFDGSACLQPRRRPLSPGGAGRPGPGEVEIAPPMSASVAPICTSSTATAMGRHLSGLPPARRHACRHLESTGIGSFASPSGGWVQGTDRPLAGAPFGHDAAEQDHARRDPRPPPGPSLPGWGRACGMELTAVAVPEASRARCGGSAIVVGGGPLDVLIAMAVRAAGAEVRVVEPNGPPATDCEGVGAEHLGTWPGGMSPVGRDGRRARSP